jgi:hypothetical protein
MGKNENGGATYLHNVTPEQLAEMLQQIVKKSFNELSTQPQPNTTQTTKDVLTRKETAEFFNVSLFCLHNWVKKGVLKPYKVSGRTYFKRNELESVLQRA